MVTGRCQTLQGMRLIWRARSVSYRLQFWTFAHRVDQVIGTIGAGRIGYRVLQRLVPFNPKELVYYDYAALPERELISHSVKICSS